MLHCLFFSASTSLDWVNSLEIKTMKLSKASCNQKSSLWYIACLLKNASVKKNNPFFQNTLYYCIMNVYLLHFYKMLQTWESWHRNGQESLVQSTQVFTEITLTVSHANANKTSGAQATSHCITPHLHLRCPTSIGTERWKKENLFFLDPYTTNNRTQELENTQTMHSFQQNRAPAFHDDLSDVKWLSISCPDKTENFRITSWSSVLQRYTENMHSWLLHKYSLLINHYSLSCAPASRARPVYCFRG